MAINKRLLVKPPSTGITPSEHFGVALYEGDGSSSHSINGGKFGAGAYFNGSNGYVTLPTNTDDLYEGQTNFSWSVWVNPSSFSSQNPIFTKYSSNIALGGLQFKIDGTTGKIGLFIANSSDSRISGASDTAISTGTWSHIVAIFDGTKSVSNGTNGRIRIFINGVESSFTYDQTAYTGTTIPAISSSVPTRLGIVTFGGGANTYHNGKIDQLRLFQKSLSSSEVSTLYAETVDTVESLDPLSEDTTDTLQVLGDSSCIATYRFENDETDLSGNYDGTGTAIQYAAGRYGQAASFNGSASKVDTSLTLDTYTSNGGSISFWFKTSQTTSYQAIIGSQTAQNGASYGTTIFIGNTTSAATDESISVWDYNGATTSAFFARGGSTTYQDGNWHHVVVTSTSTTKNIYIDGVSQSVSYAGSGSATQNLKFTDTQFGASLGHGTADFDGEIDQVRFFNKAISASEVTTLYNENSLVASYRFEGNANDDTRNYDGTATNVTYEYGLNFTPDFVWVKYRDSSSNSHRITDSTRGAQYEIYPNLTNAEIYRASGYMSSFDQGGFTVGSTTALNADGGDYVAWCLKANGGTTSSNTDGTITSTVQVNTDAGFSIVTHINSGNKSDTIGHGLGVAPKLLITKKYQTTTSWWVYTTAIDGSYDYIKLNGTDGKFDSTTINPPTSSVFYNESGGADNEPYITYAFAEVENFSSFGSYTGNGVSGGGPIIETGFEPAFVMIKNTNTSTYGWYMFDNKRNPGQEKRLILRADTGGAEYDGGYYLEFLSNGFRINTNSGPVNLNNGTFLYMAFAADPDTEAPTVAKSFSTVAYTGNDGTQDIDVGFKPGLVWLKNRNNSSDSTHEHSLFDNLRGAFRVRSNSGSPENDYASHYGGINDNGFQVKNGLALNDADGTYVAWAWKADDNEPTINTEGSIDSLVSANANAGFSIVKYTGNGTNNATVGHGLSAAPEMIIIKNLDGTYAWVVYNSTLGATKYLHLEATDAQQTTSLFFNDTNPSSTVFTLGTHAAVNESGYEMIAYCFHSVAGYSKIGSYSGNGGSNSITGLGFQPDFLLIKDSTSTGSWFMYDSLRTVSVGDNAGTANARPYILANGSGKENGVTSYNVNLDSGGFSMNTSSSELNSSGETYIYMAFKIN
jgi:hypothetical protein